MGVPIASVFAAISVAVSSLLGGGTVPVPTTAPARLPAAVIYSRAESITYTAKLPGFVRRSGAELLLDGEPFQFVGLNIYNANNLGSCWYPLAMAASMNDALSAIGPAQTVFRAWFFQPMAIRDGQLDWGAFDATLAAARAHDVRVIATLGNQYPDCERSSGANRTEAWYEAGYASDRDAGMIMTYRSWVAAVVARYGNDPTVLAWQLMNEAADPAGNGRCSRTAARTLKAFTEDMSTLIKSIDGNHLVSLGTLGVRECGTVGSDYQDVYSVANIDLCEVHDYGSPSDLSVLRQRMQQCHRLNKPMFIGEMGLMRGPTRAAALRAKLAASFEAGVSGVLVWDWANADQVAYSGYEIQPGDPALAVLASAL
ncbi:MAG TPA: cellulase family glycosylhydrolase [Candidatus Dormibacteraeota bacterium]